MNVEELLGTTTESSNESLRQRVLTDTVHVLRRRRRIRRATMAMALAGCYLAGVATVTLVRPSSAEGRFAQQAESSNDVAEQSPRAAVVIEPADTAPVVINPPVTKARTRFESLRDLGDQNLLDRRDPEAATRCYRMALRYATPDDRAWAATEGTWLMRAVNQTFNSANL
jgi:hypothetical protein